MNACVNRRSKFKMERYKRNILEAVHNSCAFPIDDLFLDFCNLKVPTPEEKPTNLSLLITLLQDKTDHPFEIFMKALASVDEKAADMIREQLVKFDQGAFEAFRSLDVCADDPLTFLETMVHLAGTLENTEMHSISSHFDIKSEPVTKQDNAALELIQTLRQKQFITPTNVKELHKALKNTSSLSSSIVSNYIRMLSFPEINLTGIFYEGQNTFTCDSYSVFEEFRRLAQDFKKDFQVILWHIRKDITLRIPSREALTAIMEATSVTKIAGKISSILLESHESFKLILSPEDIQRVEDKLEQLCVTAVPLCLPNNCKYEARTKTTIFHAIEPRKTLTVCRDGLQLLDSIGDELVVVICIAGPARSGKSFFASQFQEGVSFGLGHGAESQTTGIWVGIGPSPISIGSDKARLVVLDAEGLGGVTTDAGGVDSKWEHKIFALCVLLSSVFIYNMKNQPNYNDLDKLAFIAEFATYILHESGRKMEKSLCHDEFHEFAPDFLWLFRDNLTSAKYQNTECTWTTFVKKELLTEKQNEAQRNLIRKSIVSTFRNIRAADLPSPTFDKVAATDIKAVENKDKINPKFLDRLADEINEILSSAQIKKIKGGKVSGKQLSAFVRELVHHVNNETDNLNITGMWNSVIDSQMQNYRTIALNSYSKTMQERELPSEEEEYNRLHVNTKMSVIQTFLKTAGRFEGYILQLEVGRIHDAIEEEFKSLKNKNYSTSHKLNIEIMEGMLKEYIDEFQGNSCEQLQDAEKRCIQEYEKLAKGPTTQQVKYEKQVERDNKISNVRSKLLKKAATETRQVFTNLLEEELKEYNNASSELKWAKERCMNSALQTFEKIKCRGVHPCILCTTTEDDLRQQLHMCFETFEFDSERHCENVMSSLSGDFQVECQQVITDTLDGLELSDWKIKLQNTQAAIDTKLTEYDKNARGLRKTHFREKLAKDLSRQCILVKTVFEGIMFKTIVTKFFGELMENRKFPVDEDALRRSINAAIKDSQKEFNNLGEVLSLPFKSPLSETLSTMLTYDNVAIIRRNYKESAQNCANNFNDIVSHSKVRFSNVGDNVTTHNLAEVPDKFEKIKRDYKEVFQARAIGPLKTYYLEMLDKFIDQQICASTVAVSDSASKGTVDNFKALVARVLDDGPLDEPELKSKMTDVAEKVFKEHGQLHKVMEGTNESAISLALKETTVEKESLHLQKKNNQLSTRQCEECEEQVLKYFQDKCNSLLNEHNHLQYETPPELRINEMKRQSLQYYDNEAKGPRKNEIRKSLESKLGIEMNITMSCIEKITYDKVIKDSERKMQLCYDEARRQADSSKTFDVDKIIKDIEKQSEDIAKIRFSEESQLKVDKRLQQLREQFVRKFVTHSKETLSEIVETCSYEILENEAVQEEIDSLVERFKYDTLELMYPTVYPIVGDIKANVGERFTKLNFSRSKDVCQSHMGNLLKRMKYFVSKETFRGEYFQGCKGPAKDEVWRSHLEDINYHYSGFAVIRFFKSFY